MQPAYRVGREASATQPRRREQVMIMMMLMMKEGAGYDHDDAVDERGSRL